MLLFYKVLIALGKDESISPPAMVKLLSRLCFLSLVWQPIYKKKRKRKKEKEEKTKTLCHILFMQRGWVNIYTNNWKICLRVKCKRPKSFI